MHHLRRKLTLPPHGEQIVLVKRKQERIEHAWMRAFLWALYLPDYSELRVEVDVGAKYKPDVGALERRRGRSRFWGEAGRVAPEKIETLGGRYPRTQLALAKSVRSLDSVRATVEKVVPDGKRSAPIDLLRFPADGANGSWTPRAASPSPGTAGRRSRWGAWWWSSEIGGGYDTSKSASMAAVAMAQNSASRAVSRSSLRCASSLSDRSS